MKKSFKVIINSIMSILSYTLILYFLSYIFKNTIQIDTNNFGLWGIAVSFIIFILNKTIKPKIFSLTLPITAMTLGIFYPFINVIILKIADLIFFDHFNINGLFMSFIVACLISILNIITDQIIIQPLLKGDKHESNFI
jgi:uncharacterized membrane protein YvlD (DUF360 family)